ncbi:putative ribosomal protein S3 domain superfamily [Helianthus anomalus]
MDTWYHLVSQSAVRHVLLRQGVLGIKVKIMLDWDPTGKLGPKTPLPDNVVIICLRMMWSHSHPKKLKNTSHPCLCPCQSKSMVTFLSGTSSSRFCYFGVFFLIEF